MGFTSTRLAYHREMQNIPKPIIVFVVFFVAIAAIILSNPPYTRCNTQMEILRKNLSGDIFSAQGKQMMFSPRLNREIQTCKTGNGPGGCYELFQTLRRMNRELGNFPPECSQDLTEVGEVQRAMQEGMSLMAKIAWGESPPTSVESRFRWFEPADLALFCNLRDNYVRIFSKEQYDQFRLSIVSRLPGEPPTFSEGKCVNCEFRKMAPQVMSQDDIWQHSLFSAPCQLYR